jgi:hypothetical protein
LPILNIICGSKELRRFEEDWVGYCPKVGWSAIDKEEALLTWWLVKASRVIRMKTAEFWQFAWRPSLHTHFTQSLFLTSKTVSKCNYDIPFFGYKVSVYNVCHNIVSCICCRYFSSLWGLLVNVLSVLLVQRSILLQRHPEINFHRKYAFRVSTKKITKDLFLLVSRICCLQNSCLSSNVT